MALKFGQAASDYTPSENSDEIWIRTFKEPMTQIRICPAEQVNEKGVMVYGAEAWVMEREHYAEGIGSFPCAARFGVNCVGCDDPDEDVSQRSRKYYINALDDKAELRVFKFGVKLYKVFLGRQQRALSNDPNNKQPLSDRDYIIIKSGKGFETNYDPEPGERYEVQFPAELHDINEIISARYESAVEAYAGQGVTPRAAEPVAKIGKIGRTEVAKEDDGKVVIADDGIKPGDPDEWATWGQGPSDEQIDSAETPAIKAWLDSREIEYPSRAPRARLIEMAKSAAAPPY